MRVLLVEDDVSVVEWVRLVLGSDGHSVDVAMTTAQGRALAHSLAYDVALVDLDLPDGSGLALVIELRGAGQNLPIIVFTGRDDDNGIIACLDAGADDYVVKPVANGVLRSRVRAAVRRGGAKRAELLVFGGLSLDRLRREVRAGDRVLQLSPREFTLLEQLLLQPGTVISRADLLGAVWGVKGDTQTNMVDATVSRLRQKLAQSTPGVVVVGVRGSGYALQEAGASEQ